MPKGTKEHRDKKNSSSHEAWKNRKTTSVFKLLAQEYWRKYELKHRMLSGKFTAKNEVEAGHLGLSVIKITDGKVVGLQTRV